MASAGRRLPGSFSGGLATLTREQVKAGEKLVEVVGYSSHAFAAFDRRALCAW
jgi:hypothetical protein